VVAPTTTPSRAKAKAARDGDPAYGAFDYRLARHCSNFEPVNARHRGLAAYSSGYSNCGTVLMLKIFPALRNFIGFLVFLLNSRSFVFIRDPKDFNLRPSAQISG
jgi:hypothetical protein